MRAAAFFCPFHPKKRLWVSLLLFVFFSCTLTISAPAGASAPPEENATESSSSFGSTLNKNLNDVFAGINTALGAALFFDVSGGIFQSRVYEQGKALSNENGTPKIAPVPIPFVVALLGVGGVFFTFVYGFANIRAFSHAVSVIRGKYDRPEDEGDVSHFQALTSALSATVGLGNIAGVAIAIKLGGPGAVFWMMIAAFFGMSTKLGSCTLAQLYRQKNADGSVSGGAMYYLELGLKSRGAVWAKIGKVLAVTYALMIMGGAIGGGNMFQANQSFEAVSGAFGVKADHAWIFGLCMATLVASVILGGIKRIGAATSKLVPLMVAIYVAACLVILVTNHAAIPAAFVLIFKRAFSDNAAFGGVVGVLVWGVKRASFSNEAGLGSSAIAHAAAKTNEPVREGLVAMLEPFIDTMIVCLMTALVVIVSGAWDHPGTANETGVAVTNFAFATVMPWFPKVLSVCVVLFAYSTMISWCYYGERGWIYLLDHFGLGLKTLPIFRGIFVCFVFVGSVLPLEAVLTFSDILILCLALPNLLGCAMLIPVVAPKINDYLLRMKV